MSYREEEKRRLIERFESDTIIENGVVRWKSNNHVPPDDVIQVWLEAGKEFDLDASVQQRRIDEEAAIAQYIIGRANRTPEQIAEEQFEMRAAFGPGEKVVNIFTGEEHITSDDDIQGFRW